MCHMGRLIYPCVLRLGATKIRKRMVGVNVKFPRSYTVNSKLNIGTMSSPGFFTANCITMSGGPKSGSGHSVCDKNMVVSV
jgi:hypothetical protein